MFSNLTLNHLDYTYSAFIYGFIIILNILLLIVAILGPETIWFRHLIPSDNNLSLIRYIWIFVTLLSYIGLYLIILSHPIIINLIGIYFLLSTLILLFWLSFFYYFQDIAMSVYFSSILFIYNFGLFMYLWFLNPLYSLFFLPLLLMYVYLMYSTAHLAYLNHIIL